MIKECNIILINNEVIVVDFDGINVQMPNKAKTINNKAYVKFINNQYSLVTKEDYEKSKIKNVRKFEKENVAQTEE